MNVQKYSLLLCFCLFGALFSQSKIVPKPISMDVQSGTTALNDNSRILFSHDDLDTVALLLAAELKAVHNLDLPVGKGTVASGGDILITIDSQLTGEQYKLTVDGKVTLEVGGMDGAYPGTVTIIQAITNSEIPNMVIEDEPFRPIRSLMIDNKNYWFSLDDIKTRIKMARFYKIHYLCLHTGEKQWIGAVLDQVSDYTDQQKMAHFLYSKEEMEEIIAFGKLNGVYLFPHNESTPGFTHMKDAMQKDFNPNDQYAGYADEIDGQGSFSNFDGSGNNSRWRNLMKELHELSYAQFAKGYPEGKKMPVYHIGPVASEGGMSFSLATYFIGIIHGFDPAVPTSFWAGPSTNEMTSYKSKILPFLYTKQFHPTFTAHLQSGYTIVNSAWQPLYIVGTPNHWSRATPQHVYELWNYFRAGTDGFNGGTNSGIQSAEWDLFPGVNDAEMAGANMATWENKATDNFNLLRPRLPAFAEHAWNHKTWPYPSSDWTDFQSRFDAVDKLLDDFIKATEIGATVLINKEQGGAVEYNPIKSIQNSGRSVIIRLESCQLFEYWLMNLNGQIIKKQKGTTRSINVDTRSLPMGVYVIKLVTNGIQTVKKIHIIHGF